MGLLGSLLGSLGLVQDVVENTRTTKADVKDNKSEERKYDFDDGTGYTSEDFLRERRKRQKERQKEKRNKPKSPRAKTTDENER